MHFTAILLGLSSAFPMPVIPGRLPTTFQLAMSARQPPHSLGVDIETAAKTPFGTAAVQHALRDKVGTNPWESRRILPAQSAFKYPPTEVAQGFESMHSKYYYQPLKELGYADEVISQMTDQQAREAVQSGKKFSPN